jgi:basic membrane protein A and related proteins
MGRALVTVAVMVFLAAAFATASAGSSRHVRIGLVFEGPLGDRSHDPLQYGAQEGLERAARELHIQTKAVFDPSGIRPYAYFVHQHYDLVMGFGYTPTFAQAARRLRHARFALLDATPQDINAPAANVEGTLFRTEQAAYLAGFLAARMADREPGPHVVSSVGGVPDPQVKSFIAGFQAGAKRADPEIKLLNAYSHDFFNTAKCAGIARAQIAHGSEVVFDVAGPCGLAALEVAKQKGVYGVGVDGDQSNLGRFILTSVLKNLELAVYNIAKRVVQGRLRTGGNLAFDLRNHGVGLGKFSPVVPLALRRELAPLALQIEQGKIVVPTTPVSS